MIRIQPGMVIRPVDNFSANHLLLLSRTETPSYAVFLLRDLDTQRVYRFYDFSKAQLVMPNVAYCVAGKVNSKVPVRASRRFGSLRWIPQRRKCS